MACMMLAIAAFGARTLPALIILTSVNFTLIYCLKAGAPNIWRETRRVVIYQTCTIVILYLIRFGLDGLCVVTENDPGHADLINFGRTCSTQKVTQQAAIDAAKTVHLSGHGGTNDGIIGAAAGIGLTLFGWSGRLVDFGAIRDMPNDVSVQTLEDHGIRVLPMERDALLPALDHTVHTEGWLRPRLWGSRPVLPVKRLNETEWQVVGLKQQSGHGTGKGQGRNA